jgi:hypothetical protein
MLHHVNFDQDEFDEPRPPESYDTTEVKGSWVICYHNDGTLAAKYPARIVSSVKCVEVPE